MRQHPGHRLAAFLDQAQHVLGELFGILDREGFRIDFNWRIRHVVALAAELGSFLGPMLGSDLSDYYDVSRPGLLYCVSFGDEFFAESVHLDNRQFSA